MGVVKTTGGELLVGLNASAEIDPVKEKRRARTRETLMLGVLAVVQVGWVAGLAYAAFVFISS